MRDIELARCLRQRAMARGRLEGPQRKRILMPSPLVDQRGLERCWMIRQLAALQRDARSPMATPMKDQLL